MSPSKYEVTLLTALLVKELDAVVRATHTSLDVAYNASEKEPAVVREELTGLKHKLMHARRVERLMGKLMAAAEEATDAD